jgi:hypothetical protein
MAKIQYVSDRFNAEHLAVIGRADAILRQYANAGYTMTLRQVFYQFVSRDWLPNAQKEYSRLGSILNRARLAGLIDWNHMEDRTRNVRSLPHWNDPVDIVEAGSDQFRLDKWENQPAYVEVWVEKDALIGVLQVVCNRNDVPFFSCRGYTRLSEVWGAAMRLIRAGKRNDRDVVILHLGDHDPSGVDMSRDLRERLELFCRYHGAPIPQVRRIALNMAQIEEYDPPPNPAKFSDPRAAGYVDRFGYESWELDALAPPVLDALIQGHVDDLRDDAQWQYDLDQEEEERRLLKLVAERWDDVRALVLGEAA